MCMDNLSNTGGDPENDQKVWCQLETVNIHVDHDRGTLVHTTSVLMNQMDNFWTYFMIIIDG